MRGHGAIRPAAGAAESKTGRRLAVIPGASYLFEEAGALGHVTDLAGGWFARHLTQASTIALAA
jgi:hypothetical protein